MKMAMDLLEYLLWDHDAEAGSGVFLVHLDIAVETDLRGVFPKNKSITVNP